MPRGGWPDSHPRRRLSNELRLEEYGKRERERGGVGGSFKLYKPAGQLLKTPAILARKYRIGGIEMRSMNRSGQRDNQPEVPLAVVNLRIPNVCSLVNRTNRDFEGGKISTDPLKALALRSNPRRGDIMDKERFASQWPDVRRRVKAHWSRLTDQELDQAGRDIDTLISMIEEKYQEPRASIKMQLERLLAA